MKDKRGRGAAKKTAVFGILKRGGKVYTEIIPDCTRDTLLKMLEKKSIWNLLFISIYAKATISSLVLSWFTLDNGCEYHLRVKPQKRNQAFLVILFPVIHSIDTVRLSITNTD